MLNDERNPRLFLSSNTPIGAALAAALPNKTKQKKKKS
jgi:hypothetical protein